MSLRFCVVFFFFVLLARIERLFQTLSCIWSILTTVWSCIIHNITSSIMFHTLNLQRRPDPGHRAPSTGAIEHGLLYARCAPSPYIKFHLKPFNLFPEVSTKKYEIIKKRRRKKRTDCFRPTDRTDCSKRTILYVKRFCASKAPI